MTDSRYVVRTDAKGKHGFAVVEDLVTGDNASVFTGPNATAMAELNALELNSATPTEVTVVVHGVTYVATPTGVKITSGPRQGRMYMINAISLKLPTFYAVAPDFTGLGAGISAALVELEQDEQWVEACD